MTLLVTGFPLVTLSVTSVLPTRTFFNTVVPSTGSQNWSELKRKKRFGVTMLLFFRTTTASGHGPLIESSTDFLRRRNVSLLGYRYGTGTFIKEIQPKLYPLVFNLLALN